MDDEELNELFGVDGEDPASGDNPPEDEADNKAAAAGGVFVVQDHGGSDPEEESDNVSDDDLDAMFGYDGDDGSAAAEQHDEEVDDVDEEAEREAEREDEREARAREKKALKEKKKREKEARKAQRKKEAELDRKRKEAEKEAKRAAEEAAEREAAEKEAEEADLDALFEDEPEEEVHVKPVRHEHHEHHEHHGHHEVPENNLFKPRYVILAFLGVLLITGIVLIFTLDTFKILTINVEGNHVLKTEELIELSGIKTGDHIFFANYTKAAREIKNSSMYVRDCKVSFELPSKVNIKIDERSKICYVKTPDGYAALDDEGTIIELSSFDYQGKIAPVISGLNITHATLGRKIVIGNESDYQKSLIVLGSLLSADKNNQNRTYSIFENTEEVRVLPSGYIFLTIKLPNTNLLQVKFDSLEKISSQTAWLLYAIDSKVFDKGFPSGSLDMTLEEPVYRQFDIREDLAQDGIGDDVPGGGEDHVDLPDPDGVDDGEEGEDGMIDGQDQGEDQGEQDQGLQGQQGQD